MNTSMSREPEPPPLTVGGTRLSAIVARPGPFASLFLSPGENSKARAQVALDRLPVPAPHAGLVLDAVEDVRAVSQVVISDGDLVWRFSLEDPLETDLARFANVPSLGPVIEAAQVTTPHAVVTVEEDVFGVTSFETATSPDDPAGLDGPGIFEAFDHLVDALRSTGAQLIAIMGAESAIESLQHDLQNNCPWLRINIYPTDDIDRDLLVTADAVVTDAATLAAERRTHELAHFRQARSAAQTQEGSSALGTIEAGSAQRLLVHDDFDRDSEDGGNRLVDDVIAAAVRMDVPITMIPNVPSDRGPVDGIGVIVRGHGADVSRSSEEPPKSEVASIGEVSDRSLMGKTTS